MGMCVRVLYVYVYVYVYVYGYGYVCMGIGMGMVWVCVCVCVRVGMCMGMGMGTSLPNSLSAPTGLRFLSSSYIRKGRQELQLERNNKRTHSIVREHIL